MAKLIHSDTHKDRYECVMSHLLKCSMVPERKEMRILHSTDRSTVRAICAVQLIDRIRAKHLMLMLDIQLNYDTMASVFVDMVMCEGR